MSELGGQEKFLKCKMGGGWVTNLLSKAKTLNTTLDYTEKLGG